MADEASNQDEGFGIPLAPYVEAHHLNSPANINPELLSGIETVMLSRFNYLAAQIHHLMGQVEDMRITNSRNQSPRDSSSSAVASTDGGDDASIPSIPGDRVQEVFDERSTGELQSILTALHDPFVTVNKKKLYVQPTVKAKTDARTFIEHITKVIKEKQADPEGQEAGVAEHHEKILGYLDDLPLDLKADCTLSSTKQRRSGTTLRPILSLPVTPITKALPPISLALRELGGRAVLVPRPPSPSRRTPARAMSSDVDTHPVRSPDLAVSMGTVSVVAALDDLGPPSPLQAEYPLRDCGFWG
ncbi:hypothetical protein LRP88_13546 [Fusarium phalaenopsidis]